MLGRVNLPLLCAMAVIAVVFAFSGGVPPWAGAAALVLVLAATVAWDRLTLRRARS